MLITPNNRTKLINIPPNSMRRRTFISQLGAGIAGAAVTTSTLATEALANCIEPENDFFPLIPSQLGLDAVYEELQCNDPPIGALFSFAEQEFITNATPVFQDETGLIWIDDLFPRLVSGEFSNYDIADLREFCPEFLTKCAVAIDHDHPKYSGLWAEGSVFISEKL